MGGDTPQQAGLALMGEAVAVAALLLVVLLGVYLHAAATVVEVSILHQLRVGTGRLPEAVAVGQQMMAVAAMARLAVSAFGLGEGG